MVGNATAANVLVDKTFTNASTVGATGTMPNHGAVIGTITTSGGSYTIPAGYHNGSGKVTGPTLAALVGTSVTLTSNANLLTGNTAYGKNGVKYTGSMPNNGSWKNTPSTNGQVKIPKGYHDGTGYVDTSNVYTAAYNDGKVDGDVEHTLTITVTRTINDPTNAIYQIVTVNITDEDGNVLYNGNLPQSLWTSGSTLTTTVTK